MKLNQFIPQAVIFSIFFQSAGILQSQDLSGLKGQKPFDIHGNVSFNLQPYFSNGAQARQQPLAYVISANVAPSVYGLDMPFSFTYSNRQTNYSQPFNRFGISPRYKWITLHAGYRSLNFSNYTLAGHSFLGGGVELNPGKFRFGFIGGRFNKNTSPYISGNSESLQTFKRNGAALKLGVGGKKTFVDLLLLSVRDDDKSLPPDTAYQARKPQENLVAGLNTRITFTEKLYFEGEFAGSVHTSDRYAQVIDGIDSTLLRKSDRLIHVNQSTRFYTAGRAALMYRARTYSLKAEYRRIDPNYTSFGAYYMSTDIQSISFGPSFSLFQKRLQVRGSLGLQNDNLRQAKKVTSNRTVGSANVSWNPSQVFGIDGSYSNFSTDQKAVGLPLVDTSKIYQSNSNIAVTPRLSFVKTNSTHMVFLMLNHTGLNDKNPKTEELTENQVNTANLNYSVTLIKRRITLNTGLNYMNLSNHAGDNMAMGVSAGIMGMLAKDLISLGWSNSLLTTDYSGNIGKVITSQVSISWRLKKHHQFRLGAYFTGNYYDEGAPIPSFNEMKGDFSYVFSF
jgi:hypothetical protein